MAKKKTTLIRVFTASPGDVHDERQRAAMVIDEVGRAVGPPHNIQLEPVRWETHAWPDIGEDAQDVINRQISPFDVLVGIMWRRFGTRTKRAESGTEEEFNRAYELFKSHGRPKIMFYFRTEPFFPTHDKELTQFRKVLKFKKRLEQLGALYWSYGTPLEFERAFREHLIKQVLAAAKVSEKRPPGPKLFLSCASADRAQVAKYYRTLKADGYDPWLDAEDLSPGEDWVEAIDDAIRQTDVFLVFISQNVVSSKGYVWKEIEAGVQRCRESGKWHSFVVVVRLDPSPIPSSLAEFSVIDCFDAEYPLDHLSFVLGNMYPRKAVDR